MPSNFNQGGFNFGFGGSSSSGNTQFGSQNNYQGVNWNTLAGEPTVAPYSPGYWEQLQASQNIADPNVAAQQAQFSGMQGNLQGQLQGQNYFAGNLNALSSGNYQVPGLDPATRAALQSQAIDQNAQQYQGASQVLRQQLAARGLTGLGPGSGAAIDPLASLTNARLMNQSQLLQQGTLANAQAIQQNRQLAGSNLAAALSSYNPAMAGFAANQAGGNVNQATAIRAGLMPPAYGQTFFPTVQQSSGQQQQSGQQYNQQQGSNWNFGMGGH